MPSLLLMPHSQTRTASSDRWIEITARPLPLSDVHAFLADDRAGGTALFIGTTRRWTGDIETPWLDYDAYTPMALDQLDALVTNAFLGWTLQKAVLLHRLGRVHPTEPSVVVGVASAHRAEAFEACRWLIDTLKADVPIWKQEGVPSYAPRDSVWL
ncbi:MAG: molybdenum cofactor biosynthesis protein MoaE [Bacteroidota bacterium]